MPGVVKGDPVMVNRTFFMLGQRMHPLETYPKVSSKLYTDGSK